MSFTNLNYHIVFSTKGRRPFIHDGLRERLAEYIGGIVREMDGSVPIANGPTDHFHVVAILTPKVPLMDVIKSSTMSVTSLAEVFRPFGAQAF